MPSPNSGDKYSEIIGHKIFIAPTSEADALMKVFMLHGSNTTVSSAAPSGAATYIGHATPEGIATDQQKIGDSKSDASVGADSDVGELKFSPTTRSASLARAVARALREW